MHGTICMHPTLLTVTDEQPQPLRPDQQHLRRRAFRTIRCAVLQAFKSAIARKFLGKQPESIYVTLEAFQVVAAS
jgi:hypothetical protein